MCVLLSFAMFRKWRFFSISVATGPLYHRTGPCRKAGFIRANNFTRLKPFQDHHIVRQIPEIDTETTQLNDKFVLEEGFVRRQGPLIVSWLWICFLVFAAQSCTVLCALNDVIIAVPLNEYLLPRTMSIHGPEKVLLAMKNYPNNVELTLNCLVQLSKFKYDGES